ncbi:diguanylate cyclase (GGDEF)-like protein [Hoeflea marina]|uniref:Diguanylate cyclase (GGDEF)-like protein n=1 Tax=Hoeflea marina TaxID=274592 RepID=A0A317PPT0_9HYPH|nr:diguanylate cyclase [Hoeflea marina]PWW02149.1 diguanylate cyclase (GGDEF)-like protein [Hoeflea marina]
MPDNPRPANEHERLKRLHDYGVLDTLAEESFDRITRLAAQLLEAPISLISFIAEDRQWFKSRVGVDLSETPREHSFCAHAICQDGVMVIEDMRLDERFRENPFVTDSPHLRFYAGVPLRSPDGHNVGTLCAIDTKPRSLDGPKRALLADLAAIVLDQLEMCKLADRAQRAEDRLTDAMESLPDGFVLYGADDRLLICNRRYREIYADSADLMTPGTAFADIIRIGVERGQYPDAVGNEEKWLRQRIFEHLNPGEPIEQQLPGDRWLRIQEGRTREGGLVGFRFDITELKRQRRELTRLAWTDSLTGALNRHRFMELAETEVGRASRSGKNLAMLLIDADHFKQINDRFGHAAGDCVLQELVRRWQRVLRAEDVLGRIGGEEFCVLLPEVSVSNAMAIAERLRRVAADLPVAIEGQLLNVSVSIGLTGFLGKQDSLSVMLARSDKGLYTAKDGGRNRLSLQAA